MPIDHRVYHDNVARFPLEELDKYLGEWVAFNFTGTAIIAHSALSEDDVREQLRRQGENPLEYALEYLEGPGDVFDGPFFVAPGERSGATALPTPGATRFRRGGTIRGLTRGRHAIPVSATASQASGPAVGWSGLA